MDTKYSIGLDFGSEEARAILMDMSGEIRASAAFTYPHGVMTQFLPDGTPLPPLFALQHPDDYRRAVEIIVPALFSEKICAKNVIGIGVDFTQCTMMPVDAQRIPLCCKPEFEHNPYAYAKLWKHHAAQPQADRLTQTAQQSNEYFLQFCGGTVYAETMFPKMLETYEKAPAVYAAASEFIELADWMTYYLTGSRMRSRSIAACAALWNPEQGYPSQSFLARIDAGFSDAAVKKLQGELVDAASPVGYVNSQTAQKLGIPLGIPVAASLGDCQAAFVGAGLAQEGVMLSVMGTSSCDILVSRKGLPVPGMYGVTYGSILPTLYGYEAGQATMGDLFQWFSCNWVPPDYKLLAADAGCSIFDMLNQKAAKLAPLQSGLLALDWWSGNRSILLDTNLSGLVLGLRMQTQCEEIYLALCEALCFGKRRIIEQLRRYGAAVDRLCVTGGVANKNAFLMQLLADITGLSVELSSIDNGSCAGSALYGALAAGAAVGGYDEIQQAANRMGGDVKKTYLPDKKKGLAYEALYEEYKTLHDYFGIQNGVMKRLRKAAEKEA